jgi:L-ascorbate metabolism protein UlaG (beta-lactamase superfamily)
MKPQHMNPADSVQAFRDLGAEQAIGIHWGTFQLTNEPVEQPLTDLTAALVESGIEPARFRAMRPGEVWTPGPA